MTTERDIQQADQARLEAIVAEHGTEAEQASLLFSCLKRAGITLKQLAEDQAPGYLPPEPDILAKLSRRAERRARLRLPRERCWGMPPSSACDCGERALDQPGEDGGRVLRKLAGAFHVQPRPEPPRRPIEAPPTKSSAAVPEPRPKAQPIPEPAARVVKHFPRWYDQPNRFSDMTF